VRIETGWRATCSTTKPGTTTNARTLGRKKQRTDLDTSDLLIENALVAPKRNVSGSTAGHSSTSLSLDTPVSLKSRKIVEARPFQAGLPYLIPDLKSGLKSFPWKTLHTLR
jgi:hypothetical protein